jgi:hypothetical protein
MKETSRGGFEGHISKGKMKEAYNKEGKGKEERSCRR